MAHEAKRSRYNDSDGFNFIARITEFKRAKESAAAPHPSPGGDRRGPRRSTVKRQEAPAPRPRPEPGPEPVVTPAPPAIEERLEGFLSFPHEITDKIFPSLTPALQAVALQLYRLSWGYRRPRCRVSLPRLAKRSGLSLNQCRRVARELEARGLVEVGDTTNAGTEFLVNLPPPPEKGAKGEGAPILGAPNMGGEGSQYGRGRAPNMGGKGSHIGSHKRKEKERPKEKSKQSPAAPVEPEVLEEYRRNRAEIEGEEGGA